MDNIDNKIGKLEGLALPHPFLLYNPVFYGGIHVKAKLDITPRNNRKGESIIQNKTRFFPMWLFNMLFIKKGRNSQEKREIRIKFLAY